MPLTINQLPPAESAHLLHSLIALHWPGQHFGTKMDRDNVILFWTDGPTTQDVLRIANRFQPHPDSTVWNNSIFLSHPTGQVEIAVPTLGSISCERSYSSKMINAVVRRLGREGTTVTDGQVERILTNQDDTPDAPLRNAIIATSVELSSPPAADNWEEKNATLMAEDLAIADLCDAVLMWADDPASFCEWDIIIDSLENQETRAVLASMLIDKFPSTGACEALLRRTAALCDEIGHSDAAAHAHRLLSTFSTVGDSQTALFTVPLTPDAEIVVELGRFLRGTLG